MRRCTLCGAEKALEEFNFKHKKKGVRQKHCRSCTRLEIQGHYQRNRTYYLDKAKKRNHWYRQMARNLVYDYLKTHPCVDCGEGDVVVLEFDHLKDKIKNVSSLKSDNSIERLKLEMGKCEVRCANCHRRKTWATYNDKIKNAPL